MPAFWTGPNLLTLSRLPLAAIVWADPLNPALVLPLMAIAGLTDVADGWLERRLRRKRGQSGDVRTAGAWLDPLCDKAFVISVIAAILVARRPPLWIPALIASREILQLPQVALYLLWPGLRERLRYDFRAAVVGKAVTVLQFLAVGALLFDHPSLVPLAAACGVMGACAAVLYFRRGLQGA